ncbi:hypothetical protein TSAR_008640 [Trichomalopsis sarcophagae]|uniref:F-box domain-containing protein n=1 Tax=Trichomalopsis sarcophagae TaxID=543379 RepID=A0A232EVF5_9HYME|nr:hypothetical protein TSAR_008640 [Trichomalopsis sarcophagae]
MEDRRYSIRKRLREYDVPVEDYIEAGDYSVSPVYKLPDHLFLKIFSYLPLRDRFRIQRVCKFWQKLIIEAWESYNTLTLSLEDWGCNLSFNFPMDRYLVLKNILQVCGPFITCLDLRRSRKCTVWERIPVDNFHLISIIGEHCPNLLAIDVPFYDNSKSIRFLLASAKKLKEWTFHLEEYARFYKLPQETIGLNLTNNQCLRKLVIHVPLTASSIWNTINPQTVEEIDTIFENINEVFCEALQNWVQLKSISLSNSSYRFVTRQTHFCNTIRVEAVLKSLTSVKESLKRIFIRCLRIRGPNYAKLDHNLIDAFKNIEILELSEGDLLLSRTFFEALALEAVDDVKMLYITELPKLEELELTSLDLITDVIFINNLLVLKKLRCTNCRSLEAFGVCELIHNCKTIKSIEITQCRNVSIEKVLSEAKLITESGTDRPLRIKIE